MSATESDCGPHEGQHQERGEWIVTLHLENLLSWQEDVLEAAVIGVHDEKWGHHPTAITIPPRRRHG